MEPPNKRVSLAKANAPETTNASYGPVLPIAETPDSYLRIQQNIEGLSKALANLNDLVNTTKPLTFSQLSQAQEALSAKGNFPLNLTNLIGTIAGAVASLNGLMKAVTLAGSGLTIQISGQTITISITPTGVTPGTYAPVGSITVNAAGQITNIT